MAKQKLKEVSWGGKRLKYMRQMVLLLLAFVLVASMTACSGSLKDKITGTYYDGFHTLDIYSDGTYKESMCYGTGKWTLLDGNTLKLTDFYGKTKTRKIKEVTSEGIVFEGGYEWERKD